MKFRQRLMRFLSPISENARLDFRVAAAKASATAEDLTRTLQMNADEIREGIVGERRQRDRRQYD